jgi:hypothetical protein
MEDIARHWYVVEQAIDGVHPRPVLWLLYEAFLGAVRQSIAESPDLSLFLIAD